MSRSKFRFVRRYRALNGAEYYLWESGGDHRSILSREWPLQVVIPVHKFWAGEQLKFQKNLRPSSRREFWSAAR